MAEGDAVPPDHHVTRYCRRLDVDKGEVQGPAFELRDGDDFHSVTWLEHAAPGVIERVDQMRAAKLAMEAGGLKIRNSCWFAVLNVGAISAPIDDGAGTLCRLQTLHHPDTNPSHAGIHGLPPFGSPQATTVALALAELVTEPVFTAGDLTAVPRGGADG